jgi:hypothetical protein
MNAIPGSRVTVDRGLLLAREWGKRLELMSLMVEPVPDNRRGRKTCCKGRLNLRIFRP